MKATRFAACVVVLSLGMILAGCPKNWHFTVTKKDEINPQFCLSSGSGCSGDGVQMSAIVFQEADEKGAPGRPVWVIQGRSNNTIDYQIKTLTYGVVPLGWVERYPAGKMVANVFYSVNEEFYFRRDEHDNYIVLQREEFFRGLRP